MSIISQKITTDDKGNVRLRNTFNMQPALDLARISRECNETGRFGDKNGECQLLGYIPEEMFRFNPWLLEAQKADIAGDKGKHDYYMMKFFELFPAFQGNRRSKYWRGHRAVLL